MLPRNSSREMTTFPSLLRHPHCMYHSLDQAYIIQSGVATSKVSDIQTPSHEAVPYMAHSLAKCPAAATNVKNVSPYSSLFSILYAVMSLTAAVIAVHVPNVRADRSVTCDVARL